jgi:hypothetical protein
MMDKLKLYQVKSSYFCAAILVTEGGRIQDAAPILRAHRVIGWTLEKFEGYCRLRRWKISKVGQNIE